MPTLPDTAPDLGSLTQLQTPESNRPIVSYNPNIVTDAEEGLGKTIGDIGQTLKTKQDNIEYAFARSNYMTSMVKAAKDEENNPDWAGADARWQQTSKAALEQAQSGISNPMNREKLVADAQDYTWRVYSGVLQNADQKRKESGLASGLQADQNDQDTYSSTSDPVVRSNILQGRNARWDSLQNGGFVSPVQRFNEDKRWVTQAGQNWTDNLAPADKVKALAASLPSSITGLDNPQTPPSTIIGNAAQKNGVSSDTLSRIAMLESGGRSGVSNPSPGSTSSGLFGFTASTGAKYGVNSSSTDEQQANAGAQLLKDNTAGLTKTLGRAPTPDEQYLAHQQGVGGATALLRNPDENAVDALAPLYGGNRSKASNAITQNGGTADMTSGQFSDMWKQKFNGADTTSLQTPSAFPRTGTPIDFIEPQKRVQMWNQLKSEFKENDVQAGAAVKTGLGLVNSGMPLSDDQVKTVQDSTQGAFSPSARIAGNNLIALNDTLKQTLSMTPEDAEAYRSNLQQMQVKGVLPPAQLQTLEFMNKFVPTMQKQIKQDPVGFYERSNGSLQVNPSDPASLGAVAQRADKISSLYNVPYSQAVASKASQSDIVNSYVNADQPGKQKILQNWGAAFGPNAVSAASMFKTDAPEFPYAVGLAKDTGDMKTAMDIVNGSERIKQDKNNVIPLSKIDQRLQDSGYGDALGPDQYDQVRTAARSLFAARYSNDKNVDNPQLDGVIQGVMGPTQMTHFGSSTLSGGSKAIITPPGVTSSQMDKFLGDVNNNDILAGMESAKALRQPEGPAQVELPRFKGGVTFDTSRTPFYLKTVSPGVYHVMQPNGEPYPAKGMPDGVMAVKFDPASINRPRPVKAADPAEEPGFSDIGN